jgi:galactokinase
MDPFVACFGREGKALMLDCRSLDFRLLAVPEGISLVICNTMVKHSHAAGGYNKRREECDEGVRLLKRGLPKIRSLRDVRLEELNGHRARLPVLIYRRCRHVIAENARVLAAADALTHGDLIRFGNLMAESHKSLRDDFEVSCRELDLMVEIAASQKGVYGARMTGGGFGGCTINTVANADVNEFRESVARVYEEETGLAPEIFVSNAAEGATEVTT